MSFTNDDQTMQVSGSGLNESGITFTASTSDAESNGSVMENATAGKPSKESEEMKMRNIL